MKYAQTKNKRVKKKRKASWCGGLMPLHSSIPYHVSTTNEAQSQAKPSAAVSISALLTLFDLFASTCTWKLYTIL